MKILQKNKHDIKELVDKILTEEYEIVQNGEQGRFYLAKKLSDGLGYIKSFIIERELAEWLIENNIIWRA